MLERNQFIFVVCDIKRAEIAIWSNISFINIFIIGKFMQCNVI